MSESNMNNEVEQTSPEALIGLPCEYDGLLWKIESYAKGWFTLVHSDGETRKARRAQFELLEDEEEVRSSKKMTETLNEYRKGYVPSIAASGKKSLSCGDRLAQALEGMHYECVYALAEYWCELAVGSLAAKYAHLKNDGMRRMNAGNRLRRLVRLGEEFGEEAKGRAFEFCEWLEDDDAIKAAAFKTVDGITTFHIDGVSEDEEEAEDE